MSHVMSSVAAEAGSRPRRCVQRAVESLEQAAAGSSTVQGDKKGGKVGGGGDWWTLMF